MGPLTQESIQALRSLPEFASQSSPLSSGAYVVRSPKERIYVSPDNQSNAVVWFTSPVLLEEDIQHIDKVQLFADSHDQGYANDPRAGNWTWFELALMENKASTAPRYKDGIALVWRSHRNRFLDAKYDWAKGAQFGARHDILRLLEPGNVIAVRLCARFKGWTIAAREGLLVFHVGKEKLNREAPEFAPIVRQVRAVQSTLDEVNHHIEAAWKPQASTHIFRADSFATTDKKPLRLLALDGGGVRGLASLELLDALMEKAAPDKRPCEIFDMIGGTSTGGLIAIMLGRLKMTVKETIEKYKAFMNKIFGKSKIKKDFDVARTGFYYDASTLESVIKDVVREKLGTDDAPLLEDKVGDEHQCRV